MLKARGNVAATVFERKGNLESHFGELRVPRLCMPRSYRVVHAQYAVHRASLLERRVYLCTGVEGAYVYGPLRRCAQHLLKENGYPEEEPRTTPFAGASRAEIFSQPFSKIRVPFGREISRGRFASRPNV